jgi:ubiquitin thioesterase ZRANB1
MDDNNNNVKDEQTIIIRKWKCEECTYDNWPSATKCTLCRNINRKQQYKLTKSTSPPVVVCQNSPIARTPTNQIQLQPTTNDQDIYRLANIIINEDEQQQESDSTNADANRKWNCPICTYLNWPKSKKCVQCYTQRCSRRSSPRQNSPRSCPQSPCTIPKRINDVQAHTSLTPPVDLVLAQPEEQATMTNMLKKWTCSVCTYENWPKSVKCIMCKLNRQTQQQPTLTNNNNKRILLAPSQNAVFTTSSGNDNDRLFLLACQGKQS